MNASDLREKCEPCYILFDCILLYTCHILLLCLYVTVLYMYLSLYILYSRALHLVASKPYLPHKYIFIYLTLGSYINYINSDNQLYLYTFYIVCLLYLRVQELLITVLELVCQKYMFLCHFQFHRVALIL